MKDFPMKYEPKTNGTSYDSNTPPRVIQILERARHAHMDGEGYRLRITTGDPATGIPHDPQDSDRLRCGYIGRSCGPQVKAPLILPNRNSMGGFIISTNNIVRIEYANKKYGGVLFDITPSVDQKESE